MNKRDDTSRLPAIWKPALIDKQVPNTRNDTRSTLTRATQDVTNTHSRGKQTQTHTDDEIRPRTRSHTAAASLTTLNPSNPYMKQTDTHHEDVARPRTRSQTTATQLTSSNPPATQTNPSTTKPPPKQNTHPANQSTANPHPIRTQPSSHPISSHPH
ncbi:mucin-7-like [Pituophis catenifer annectens]|uniref:mucin-7-like n=1 Tax=Pituophis catenifer annectens TaxID=94852 RepID=UPI003992DC16